MDAHHAERIELLADFGAAAIFAVSAGYSSFLLGLPVAAVVAICAAAMSLALLILTSIKAGSPVFSLQPFEAALLPEAVEMAELVLTEADRLEAAREDGDALILEDVLTDLSKDSRVVRLFDPSSMPTAGELQERIARHFNASFAPPALPDASRALHDALAELRRSIR